MQVCAGCAAQGLCSILGQSQPRKTSGLTLSLAPDWPQGYTKAKHKTRDLNCPKYMSTAQLTLGANNCKHNH